MRGLGEIRGYVGGHRDTWRYFCIPLIPYHPSARATSHFQHRGPFRPIDLPDGSTSDADSRQSCWGLRRGRLRSLPSPTGSPHDERHFKVPDITRGGRRYSTTTANHYCGQNAGGYEGGVKDVQLKKPHVEPRIAS